MPELVPPSKDILVLVLENSCRLGCPHCFVDAGQGDFDQARRVAFKAHDLGYKAYFYATQITKRCFEIYKYIGQDLDDGSICVRAEFAERQLDGLVSQSGRVGFSIHGARKETHELITGPGTWERTLDGIRAVRNANKFGKINLWCTLHGKNYREVTEICELAADLGVHFLNFQKLSFLGRARSLPSEWFLGRDEIGHILRMIQTVYDANDPRYPHITLAPNWGITEHQAARFEEGKKLDYYPTKQYCPAGRQHFTVHSRTLAVYSCHHFAADERFIIGRWTDDGLLVERDNFHETLRSLEEPCGSCNIAETCGGGCRAEAVGEHMRLTGEYNPYAGLTTCRRTYNGEHAPLLTISTRRPATLPLPVSDEPNEFKFPTSAPARL